ncbi:MAG: efflux RND transporter periplasmic adaptor subunit [Pedobacter sp.]
MGNLFRTPKIGLGLLLAALLLTSGCRDRNQYVAPPPPAVTVALPQLQDFTHFAQYSGLTEAVASVEIRARVEGYLQSIHFTDSALVKKGDLLFVIDPKPYQARLDEAEATLAMRQAEVRLTESTLKRKESAFEEQAVSEVDVIEARAQRDQAVAAVAAAQAAIETARLELSYTRIHAPLSGRIGRRLVDVGNLVGAEEKTLLATIVSTDPMYVYFNVNERDLLDFQSHNSKQQTPTSGNGRTPIYLGLSNETGYPHPGKIDYVDNRVDADTGTIQVRGVFDNADGSLLPGLFARVQAPIRKVKQALMVPEEALGLDLQGHYLLCVDDKDEVVYHAVTLGPKVEGRRVVETGLEANDRVIIKGLQKARPGIVVQAVTEPPQNTPVAAGKKGKEGGV